jgi:heat shock protein 5
MACSTVEANTHGRVPLQNIGKLAGLETVRILDEPIAAAMAYGLDQPAKEWFILVVHLGGRTLDVTALTIDNGLFEILATGGDNNLGGEDLTDRVVQYYVRMINKKYRKDIANEPHAMRKLRTEIERAKHVLSRQHATRLEIEFLFDYVDFSESLTRARFEELTKHCYSRALATVKEVLVKASLKVEDVDHVILTGGSTRIPMLRHVIEEYFKGKPCSVGLHPEETVAYGAALHADILARDEVRPARYFVEYDTAPLSLGVKAAGGIMVTLVPRNFILPVQKSQMFTPHEADQTTVLIQIYEGEHPHTQDNYLLAEMELSSIPTPASGVAKIDVTLSVDQDGTIQASASVVEGFESNSTSKHGVSSTVTIAATNQRRPYGEIAQILLNAYEASQRNIGMRHDNSCDPDDIIRAVCALEQKTPQGTAIDVYKPWIEEEEPAY